MAQGGARRAWSPPRASAAIAVLALIVVLVDLSAATGAKTAPAALPRGVRPSRARFYPMESTMTSTQTFRCLDGSGDPLPASRFIDDYCDCVDGSDEPGEREKERERERKRREREDKEKEKAFDRSFA